MLHVRKMVPALREKIAEQREENVTVKGEAYFSRDAKSGVLVMEGRTDDRVETRSVPTGKLVERFTTGTGKNAVVHEGSMVAQDTVCKDCGAGLIPANDKRYDFPFLICGRIEDRDVRMVKAVRHDEKGALVQTHLQMDPGEVPKLFRDCVLECGRAGL